MLPQKARLWRFPSLYKIIWYLLEQGLRPKEVPWWQAYSHVYSLSVPSLPLPTSFLHSGLPVWPSRLLKTNFGGNLAMFEIAFFFFFSNYYKTWKMFSTKNILSMSLLWRNVMLFWKNGKDEVTYVMFGTGRIGGRGFHHSLSRKV